MGPLLTGVRSILMEGCPISPSVSRFAEVIHTHKPTIFKTGASLISGIMTSELGIIDQLKSLDLSSLKHASFCAEPVSESVHRFACQHITPNFMNSYWATEHGGILLTRRLGHTIEPDTTCWPLPWIDVRVDDLTVQVAPYPYLAQTLFGDDVTCTAAAGGVTSRSSGASIGATAGL